MTGATICSGILAPEVAMPWVDWQWCAEIDPFACALIKHRRPTLRNLGDVTAPDFRRCNTVDLLVAGTPCQAFSVAGQRKSLDDSRGNITLRLVEIVHAIRPRILLWENVPGVLSTPDNAFGCFLGGLVGAPDAIISPAGWSSAGVVDGPIGTAAWRVLDAQYFGLAQRRQRVFLVFNFGNRAIGPEILFEWEGMRRDSPPRRETAQRVAPTIEGRTGTSGATNFHTSGGLIEVSICAEVSPPLNTSWANRSPGSQAQEWDSEQGGRFVIAPTLGSEPNSEDVLDVPKACERAESLREALHAGEESRSNLKSGGQGSVMAVRRLTPL